MKMPTAHEALYRTMHNCHDGYINTNQGLRRLRYWLPLLPDPPVSILDVGCGNGKLCELLADMDYTDITGLDIVPGPYDRKNYNFVQHDLLKGTLPFKDKEFDVCFSFDAIEHLPEKYDEILAEMLRVSKLLIGTIACFDRTILHPTVFEPGRWIAKISELSQDTMGYKIFTNDANTQDTLFFYTNTRKKV